MKKKGKRKGYLSVLRIKIYVRDHYSNALYIWFFISDKLYFGKNMFTKYFVLNSCLKDSNRFPLCWPVVSVCSKLIVNKKKHFVLR